MSKAIKHVWLGVMALVLSTLACSRQTEPPVYVVTATLQPPTVEAGAVPGATATPVPLTPTPTLTLTPAPLTTPTLDPIFTPDPETGYTYVVQYGDTLLSICLLYDTNIPAMLELNSLADEFGIYAGQVLKVPGVPVVYGPAHKIIPDSELVYGPALRDFDAAGFVSMFPGYLRDYVEEVEGVNLTGAQIVQKVADNFSISPRLLLALLEHQSGWLLTALLDQFKIDYPMGYADENYAGLYGQLRWAANQLSYGYYGVRNRGMSALVFPDGTRLAFAPGINAGTAAIQYFFAQIHEPATWQPQVMPDGFFTTYVALFGNPFVYAVDPLVPHGLEQPALVLPWAEDETWYYTGGPHGAWASGSGWGAVDFAPPGEAMGCYISEWPTRAAAPGVVVRSGDGAVLLDLDGDGCEQTGWVIFYMHLTNRVEVGTAVNTGDLVGYPSCEGGFSTATHVHVARKYNGEWIPAYCENCAPGLSLPPFVMGGWTIGGFLEQEYDGYMTRGDVYREAYDGGRVDEVSGITW
ncbi:MAG: LysM peptidoglycan-binding domain-containing protein [Anaerolineae bacterium]|nr:LysM peptidoglycan-binding domain-containing protein [Anaerolineae bacterium]